MATKNKFKDELIEDFNRDTFYQSKNLLSSMSQKEVLFGLSKKEDKFHMALKEFFKDFVAK
jgi:hypothetical protein